MAKFFAAAHTNNNTDMHLRGIQYTHSTNAAHVPELASDIPASAGRFEPAGASLAVSSLAPACLSFRLCDLAARAAV